MKQECERNSDMRGSGGSRDRVVQDCIEGFVMGRDGWVLCPGMNPDIGGVTAHTLHPCYEVLRALNFS